MGVLHVNVEMAPQLYHQLCLKISMGLECGWVVVVMVGGGRVVRLENDQPYPGIQRAVVPTEVRETGQTSKQSICLCVFVR